MKDSRIKQLWSEIDEIPFHPRIIREPLGTIFFSLPDIPAYIFQNMVKQLPLFPQTTPFFYPYKRNAFSKKIFTIKKGLKLKAEVGERKNNERTIVLVHGIFQSKNFRFIRNIANHLYEDYSFNVIIVDIRDHLGTAFLSPYFPASAGLLEGEDILEIASQFRVKNRTTKIFLLGFSYGGAVVLNALNFTKAKDVISGVIAVSPTMILDHAIQHIDRRPAFFEPFHSIYNLFKLCLRLRYGVSIRTFDKYIENSAKSYGYKKKEMMKRSSVTEFIKRIEVPTLMLLSKDDSVIPEGDIEAVVEQSRSNENIKILVKEQGGHIAFSFIAPVWFFKVIDTFCNVSL